MNHSQAETPKMNAGDSCAVAAQARERPGTVVRMLPTNTVNITGLRSWRRGSSLRNESTTARRTIGGSNSGRAFDAVDMFRWIP